MSKIKRLVILKEKKKKIELIISLTRYTYLTIPCFLDTRDVNLKIPQKILTLPNITSLSSHHIEESTRSRKIPTHRTFGSHAQRTRDLNPWSCEMQNIT